MVGLNRKDGARLDSVLAGMPLDLAFLREAVKDIARQDQELLGSGEADTNALMRALRRRVSDGVVDAGAIAEAFGRWVGGIAGTEESWAGPLWFVAGFLASSGALLASDLVEIARPAAKGLERTTLEVPAGMKVKRYHKGVELTKRGVQIIVIELEPGQDAIELERYRRAVSADGSGSPDWPPAGYPRPAVVYELAEDFGVGEVRGLRFTMRQEVGGAIMMQEYLLSVGRTWLRVAMFSKRAKGGGLEAYEGMLGTIREVGNS